jgi:HK97 family phage portal protein
MAFGIAIAQDRFVESFYLNSANPMGVIEVPGPMDLPETRKMLRGWLAAHQGLNKANLPAILTEDAHFKPITISPADSQLLEALQFSESCISGRIFRIPPHMVGMVDRTTSWGKGIEQQERGFVTNTLVGYLVRGSEAMTSVHPPGQYVSFDTSERLRGTALERAQTGSLGMLAGWVCADDVRDTFDLPPLPNGEGQNVYVPINTELLQMALEQLKQLEAGEQDQEPPEQDEDDEQQPVAKKKSSTGNGNGTGAARKAALLEIIGQLGAGR